MTIDKTLEEKLWNLPSNSKTGKIVGETNSVTEISDYLTKEKIRHCSLPKQGKIIIGAANYKELKRLNTLYTLNITDVLKDVNGENALRKLDGCFSFEPGWGNELYGGNSPHNDVYDVKDEVITGTIIHKTKFERKKYKGVEEITDDMSGFHAPFETIFEIVLDQNVKGVYPNVKHKLLRR